MFVFIKISRAENFYIVSLTRMASSYTSTIQAPSRSVETCLLRQDLELGRCGQRFSTLLHSFREVGGVLVILYGLLILVSLEHDNGVVYWAGEDCIGQTAFLILLDLGRKFLQAGDDLLLFPFLGFHGRENINNLVSHCCI